MLVLIVSMYFWFFLRVVLREDLGVVGDLIMWLFVFEDVCFIVCVVSWECGVVCGLEVVVVVFKVCEPRVCVRVFVCDGVCVCFG